jgi:hypothetical protein
VKVVGTGAPRMLTILFEPCELDLLRSELEERRGVVIEAIARVQEPSRPALPGELGQEHELQHRHDQVLSISELLDGLQQPAPRDQPREVVGPTWLLGDVVRAAAGEAVDRLDRAVGEFREDRGEPTREELRRVLATAAAWVETLIGLDYADYHRAG